MALTRWIVVGSVVRDDAGDQRFEGRVPTELLRVDLPVSHDDPAEVTGFAERTNGCFPFGHPMAIVAPSVTGDTKTSVRLR